MLSLVFLGSEAFVFIGGESFEFRIVAVLVKACSITKVGDTSPGGLLGINLYFDNNSTNGITAFVPIDGSSRFQVVPSGTSSIEVSEVRVCWFAQTNKVYQPQYRSRLTTNTWADLGGLIEGVESVRCVTVPVSANQPPRFYQIVELP